MRIKIHEVALNGEQEGMEAFRDVKPLKILKQPSKVEMRIHGSKKLWLDSE